MSRYAGYRHGPESDTPYHYTKCPAVWVPLMPAVSRDVCVCRYAGYRHGPESDTPYHYTKCPAVWVPLMPAVSRDVCVCRYAGYRHGPESDTPYHYTSYHWLQLCARLCFVIVFEVIYFTSVFHKVV